MSFLIYNVWHSIKNKTHKEARKCDPSRDEPVIRPKSRDDQDIGIIREH